MKKKSENQILVELLRIRQEIEALKPRKRLPVVHPMDVANLPTWAVEGRDYIAGVGR
jgi:hypothetical protein